MKKTIIGLIVTMVLFIFLSQLTVKAVDEVNLVDFYRDGKYLHERISPSNWGDGAIIQIPDKYVEKKEDFRGVWVATVYNIDMPRHTSQAQFQTNFLNILENLVAFNMNAVIFQISSTNDAFYPSEIVPWTRWLTGTEGTDPGWDPLEWMIAESHKRGIEFHAWMNPYNVHRSPGALKDAYLNSLSDMNFAKQNPQYVLESNTAIPGLTLNPGEPAVVDYVVSKVVEVIENYNVDAIHFDDYFYPYEGFKSGQDQATFLEYGAGMTLADWRRSNVNTMVQSVSEAIRSYNLRENKRIQFGISPFGVWCNIGSNQCVANGAEGSVTRNNQSYVTEHADTLKWIREEWLDYVVPQLYWGFDNLSSTYSHTLDWWANAVKDTNVNLYSGMALYRSEEPLNSSNGLGSRPTEIADQIRYNTKHAEVKGSVFYNYSSFASNRVNLRHSLDIIQNEFWQTRTLTPASRQYDDARSTQVVAQEMISSVNNSYKLSWNKVEDAFGYSVYRTEEGQNLDRDSMDQYVGFVSNKAVNNRIVFFDQKPQENVVYHILIIDSFKLEADTAVTLSSLELSLDDGIFTPLEAVQNLRIVGKVLPGKEVKINWNQVSPSVYGQIQYDLYKSLDGEHYVKLDMSNVIRMGTTFSYSYTFVEEDVDQNVHFKVKATDGHLFSSSNIEIAQVESILPLAPITNFLVVTPFAVNTSIRLEWDRLLPTQDVTVQYTLYYSPDGVEFTRINQTQNLVVLEESKASYSFFLRQEHQFETLFFKLEATDTYTTQTSVISYNLLQGNILETKEKMQNKFISFIQKILR